MPHTQGFSSRRTPGDAYLDHTEHHHENHDMQVQSNQQTNECMYNLTSNRMLMRHERRPGNAAPSPTTTANTKQPTTYHDCRYMITNNRMNNA